MGRKDACCRNGGVETPEMLHGRLGSVLQLDLTPHVDMHRQDMATARRSDRGELSGRGEGVFDGRNVGADVDGHNGPAVGDQLCDGGCADPAGGAGDEGDRSVHDDLSSSCSARWRRLLAMPDS